MQLSNKSWVDGSRYNPIHMNLNSGINIGIGSGVKINECIKFQLQRRKKNSRSVSERMQLAEYFTKFILIFEENKHPMRSRKEVMKCEHWNCINGKLGIETVSYSMYLPHLHSLSKPGQGWIWSHQWKQTVKEEHTNHIFKVLIQNDHHSSYI